MIGYGSCPTEAARVRRDEEGEVRGRLELAVKILAEGMSPSLVPVTGADIGYALRGARTRNDVAGIEGGIVKMGGGVHPSGGVTFGAGEVVARVVLTALRTDPAIRSAAVIRYSPATIAVLEALLLEICEFDRAREPPGVSTMDWGVASCCREGVPDVIFDRGAAGREPLIRILGEEPVSVAQTIVAVSHRLF
ncbi:MAG: thiamine-phosphate synthase family protein [Methanomicrobiales archaeon]|jgi:hydroxymethylpyrimidine/phosphomethylpyrimidine kinase